MREAGVDRSTFLQKVYFPVLKYLNVSRQEVVEASKLVRHAPPPPVAAVKKAAEAASASLLSST